MTPGARLQAAMDILGTATDQPLDRFLKSWFRTRRFAGSGDRRAIGEMVFAVMRARARLAHRMGGDSPRALMIAALLEEGKNPDELFTGGYGPAPLTDAERAIIGASPPDAPAWVRHEYPQFLESELLRAFGERLPMEMAALKVRAPLDLRVNRLKARRDDVVAALGADGVACAPTPYAPDGIRTAAGTQNLAKHTLFESGALEIQDEAAQIASLLCGAAPGMRVCDLAAGAGGKSLALAAAMENAGEIIACDIRGEALAELERRAARAGAGIIAAHILGPQPPGAFDLVLLDAPCSGSGTWRRQPENKWRLTPEKLAARMALQDRLLEQAAALVRPGGRLVYATCSVLPCENQDRVAAFLASNPRFTALDAATAWGGPPVPGLGADFRASPATTGTDGFFCALLACSGS